MLKSKTFFSMFDIGPASSPPPCTTQDTVIFTDFQLISTMLLRA